MKEKIGNWRGVNISEMTREQLLEFAAWAAVRIQDLEMMADKHLDLDLRKEVLFH